MKKGVLVLMMLLTSICGFSKDKEKLTIGLYSSPPFVVVKNDGTISGVSVELWEKIATTLGIKYETKLYSDAEIDKLINDVESGYIDMAIGSITINQQRLNKVDFSLPYFTTKLGIASINAGPLGTLYFLDSCPLTFLVYLGY